MTDDDLALLAKYAPSPSSITTWTPQRETDVLAEVFGTSRSIPLVPVAPRRRRTARWAPALVAACVLALVVGLGLVFGTGGGNASGGSQMPSLQVHPWHARAIRTLPPVLGLVGHDSSLYALDEFNATLLDIDASNGAVLHRARVPHYFGDVDAPIYAGGRIWVAIQTSRTRVTLTGFDLSLASSVHTSLALAVIRGNEDFGITAPADGSALYVSTGRHVVVLDPRTGRSRARVAMDAERVTVSPDGNTLYVGNVQHTTVTSLDTRDRRVLHRWTEVGSVHVSPRGWGTLGLEAATDEGFFAKEVLARDERTHRLARFFYSADDFARVRIDTGFASGPQSPTHATGGVAWGSGGSQLSCVDPGTGRVLARSDSYRKSVSIWVTDLDGRLFGTYTTDDGPAGAAISALIELTPPKACGLSS